MKLSVNWLLELVNFKGSIPDLVDLLTHAGCKVESVETRGVALDNVVVAEILESERHPNADRLSVCQVADGSDQTRQIVCGAKNYRVGDKVPLALPGAILPGNFKIQVGKLRGVESQGMLCSARELALSEDGVGLLILPKEIAVGIPISDVFPQDSILDLEITPNRGDWLSHLGIAREVAVFTGAHLNWQSPALPKITEDPSKVRIDENVDCSAYSLRHIRGVQVGESPMWLRSKLEAVGLRSVNNVVDVTNYVMFLLGQPLHAFDADRVSGGIVVRSGTQDIGEFSALDGKHYSLASEDIVISDAQGALALGGVIGGETSSVSSETTDIFLESAVFDPAQIRRTARRLELSTDSSYRFERGVDGSMMLIASELAVQLIGKVAGGVPDDSVITAGNMSTERPQIRLRHNRVNRLLGLIDLKVETISDALKRIGLKLIDCSDESSAWEIPGYRRDLIREVDLIEEVARVLGIESIPEKNLAEVSPTSKADAAADFHSILRSRLTAQGFFEARTSTLVNYESWREFIDESQTIRLKNPLGEDQAFLRPTLIPGLLSAAQRNFNHGQHSIRLYEMGKIFRRGSEEEIPSLGIVMTGASAPASWKNKETPASDLYDLKGTVQTLILQPVSFAPAQTQTSLLSLPPGSLCLQVLTSTGQFLGLVGQLAPARSRELGIPGALLVAELLLQPLQATSGKARFLEIPRYPEVHRDIAVVVPKSTPYQHIEDALLSAGESLLTSVAPFDIFTDPTGEKLPADRKSIAVSLVFRSLDRTLTSEEVTVAEERLRKQLVTQLGAEFRVD